MAAAPGTQDVLHYVLKRSARPVQAIVRVSYEGTPVKFTKMHGIGNDYVYVNGFAEQVENPSKVAEQVSDRHFGIGGDGLILILPSETADVRMQMFNADGKIGEM